jgi:predicted transcriptional regulator
MLPATMPRPRKTAKPPTHPPTDVFSRLDAEAVRKLDELADNQRRSRSSMIAHIIDQYIKTEYPKLIAERESESRGRIH